MEKILRQSFWLFTAQIATRIIGFFYVIYLAKTLGVSDFGLYTVALAYFSIISSFADFGFNRFLITEVAKDRSKAQELFWNVVMLRLTLTSALFAVFAVVLYLIDPDKLRVSLILLATLAILPQSVGLTVDAIFVAIQKLQFSAVALIVISLSTALVGWILLVAGFGPTGAVNALIFGQVMYCLILLVLLQKHIPFSFLPIKTQVVKKIIIGSLPYGVLGIIGLVSFRMDTVILSYLRGNFETGIYGAAYKFLDSVIFIPTALAMASFPVFTKLLVSNLPEVKRVYFSSIKMMFLAGTAVMLIYMFIMPEIMKFLLPNYLSSIGILKILSLSIPFIFIHIPSGQVLLSTDKYLKKLLVMYIALFSINLLLYSAFIPQFGALGAAWVTVLSEILTFLTFYLYLRLKVF